MKRPYNHIAFCWNCGKKFGTYTWEVNRGRGRYCSKTCRNIAGGEGRASTVDQSGNNNPNWKNGISKDNYHYKLIQKERYPERVKAREICYEAIRTGKLKKEPCELCGEENVQAHHEDYSKPLEVRWLCPDCHRTI